MTLDTYHQKRDFKKTPEPFGKKKATYPHLLYVIQKHAASHLHYDLRLQFNGVLKSWAIPKGPSLDPNTKRLAVEVEDHPIEYGTFEGIIPKGQYGGGTVMLWDKGEWEPQDDDPEKAFRAGNVTFLLKGKRLKGLWKLIRTNMGPKSWLLLKLEDKYARDENEYNVTEAEQRSIATNRTMDAIAGHKKISTKLKKSKKPKP